MFNSQQIRFLASLGILGASAVNLAFASGNSSDIQQIISDQRSRQIARQISDSVTRRVTSEEDETFSGPNKLNPKGASGDSSSFMPDSLWSSFSWSNISNDNLTTPFNVNVYQSTTGIDKKIGDFFVGATVAYAGTTTDVGPSAFPTEGSDHSIGITPYLAYVFNKNFFLSAMTGYNYAMDHFHSFSVPSGLFNTNTQAETDSFTSELDLNGMHVIDQWFMNGKIGIRHQHGQNISTTDTAGFASTRTYLNTDVLTYLTSAEGGYAFKNGIRTYTGILYEYAQVSHNLNNFGVFYYSAGADYSVNKKLSVGAKVQTDLSNQNIDITTVGLNVRLLLD